jgi:hypothetical protein
MGVASGGAAGAFGDRRSRPREARTCGNRQGMAGRPSPLFYMRPMMTNGTPGTISPNTVPVDASSEVVGSTVLRFTNTSNRIPASLILTLDDQGFASISSTGPCTASVLFSLTLERIDISQTIAHEVVEAATPHNGQVPISFRPRATFSVEPGGTIELRDGGDAVARATAPASGGSAVAAVCATEVFSITNDSSADVIMETSALATNGLNLSLSGVGPGSTGLALAALAPFTRQTLDSNSTLFVPITFSPQSTTLGPNQTLTSSGRLVAVVVIG